jgi:DME family drug/metabolite transporter
MGALLTVGDETWAFTGVTLRRLPPDLDPLLANALRALVGLLLYVPVLALSGSLGQFAWLNGWQVGLLLVSVLVAGVVGDALYLTGLRQLGLSKAFPIVNSYPLFAILFGYLLGTESFSWGTLLGALLVIAGLTVVSRGRSTEPAREAASRPGLGVALVALTAALYGLEGVLIALADVPVNGMVANAVRAPVVVVVGLAATTLSGRVAQVRTLSAGQWGMLALSGALGWVVAGSMWLGAVGLIGAATTSTIGATAPLFAAPLGMLFLRERPGWNVLVGTLVSMVGILLVL